MDESPTPSDADRELAELRERAYGPGADIQTDPVALARLWELEGAHLAKLGGDGDSDLDAPADDEWMPAHNRPAAKPDADDPEADADIAAEPSAHRDPSRSAWQRLTTTRAGRISTLAGALAVVVVVVYSATWAFGPHPDATLRPAPDEANGTALAMVDFLGGNADVSTLRGYERYRGITPWFFVDDDQGFRCFMLVTRPVGVDGANCVPPGVDLFADITPWPGFVDENSHPVPEGSIIRFRYLEDRVDVYVYPAADPD